MATSWHEDATLAAMGASLATSLNLILVSGLPGTGKSSIADGIGRARRTPVLSVDPIESAIVRAGVEASFETGLAAYLVAETLAEHHLAADLDVVIDAVSAVDVAREGGRVLAAKHGAALHVIVCMISDEAVHRARLGSRHRELAFAGDHLGRGGRSPPLRIDGMAGGAPDPRRDRVGCGEPDQSPRLPPEPHTMSPSWVGRCLPRLAASRFDPGGALDPNGRPAAGPRREGETAGGHADGHNSMAIDEVPDSPPIALGAVGKQDHSVHVLIEPGRHPGTELERHRTLRRRRARSASTRSARMTTNPTALSTGRFATVSVVSALTSGCPSAAGRVNTARYWPKRGRSVHSTTTSRTDSGAT